MKLEKEQKWYCRVGEHQATLYFGPQNMSEFDGVALPELWVSIEKKVDMYSNGVRISLKISDLRELLKAIDGEPELNT